MAKARTSRIVGLADGQPLDPAAAGPQQGALLPPPAPAERVKVAASRPKAKAREAPAGEQAPIQFEAGPFPVGERRWSVVHDWADTVAEGHGLSPGDRFVLHTVAIGAAESGEARMGRTFLRKRTGLSRDGVREAVRRLEARGIFVVEAAGKRGHRATRYRFSGGDSLAPRGRLTRPQGATHSPPSEESTKEIPKGARAYTRGKAAGSRPPWQLSESELMAECKAHGIGTVGKGRKELDARLQAARDALTEAG